MSKRRVKIEGESNLSQRRHLDAAMFGISVATPLGEESINRKSASIQGLQGSLRMLALGHEYKLRMTETLGRCHQGSSGEGRIPEEITSAISRWSHCTCHHHHSVVKTQVVTAQPGKKEVNRLIG